MKTNSVRRHIGFGSTPSFKNLYTAVRQMTDTPGRLKYADYNPSLGIPPTEEQKEKLQEYSPKIPTLTFAGSEKLHGENMAVCCSGDEVWVQGRNHIRTILGDQNGMAQFVELTKAHWDIILTQVENLYDINIHTHTIVLDMEWAGGNIQKGNAACSGTDKGAYLFDYCRIVTNETGETQFKSLQGINIPEGTNIYLMSNFGSYTLHLDFNKPSECEEQLEKLAVLIEEKSPIAQHFNKPDNVGEGVYLWAEYNGEMLRVKAKGEKHGGKPKTPKDRVERSSEKIEQLTSLANKVTPVWRLTQAITETGASEIKHIGMVIKWVMQDIAKEEVPVLIEAGITLKDLNSYVAKIVKEYYFDSLKEALERFKTADIPFSWCLGSDKQTIAALRFSGAVEFGSRALGVHSEHSDYDFAILKSNYLKLFPNCDLAEIRRDNYFKIKPGYGHNYLKKRNNIDILVLEHQEHLDTVRKAVEELKTLPTYFLEDKPLRISLYEKSLEVHGFINKNSILPF